MRFRKSQPRSRSTAEPADHDHEVHDHDALGGGATLSRRGMLVGAGTLSLAGVLAACGDDPSSSDTARTSGDPNAPRTASTAPSSALPAGDAQILDELLAQAPQCPMTSEETEGPYWFDVDYIRSDIREDRQGVPLELALRVVDLDDCQVDGDPAPIRDAVVEIWHCDAAGIYSGFEKASSLPDGGLGGGPGGGGPRGGPGQGGPGAGGPGGERPTGLPDGPPPSGFPGEMPDMPGAGAGESDGSYSAGERQSERTDTEIYLRGAQSTDRNGVVRFTSIFPGWYTSRTVHIHLRVHIDRKTVRTSQLYFDDALTDAIHAGNSPYDEHPGRDTRNDTDHIYDATGLLQGKQQDETVFAALNLGVTKGSKGGA